MVKNKILKYILYVALAILTALHIMKIIVEGFDIDQLSIIAFIMIFISILKEKRIYYGYSFFIMGTIAILCLNSFSDLSAVPILFIAVLYYSKPLMLVLISITIPVSFMASYYMDPSGSVSHIIEGVIFNYAFLAFLYFAVIRQPSDIDHLARVTPLDRRQLLILKYLARDISRKEMPGTIPERELWKYDIDNFTIDIINSEIAKIKKVLDIKSEFALGIWYSRKAEIETKSCKIAKSGY